MRKMKLGTTLNMVIMLIGIEQDILLVPLSK
jgi:hypothetical protein